MTKDDSSTLNTLIKYIIHPRWVVQQQSFYRLNYEHPVLLYMVLVVVLKFHSSTYLTYWYSLVPVIVLERTYVGLLDTKRNSHFGVKCGIDNPFITVSLCSFGVRTEI